MVPLVYSPAYNVSAFGLERLHPFDGQKYRRIRDWLIAQGLRRPGDFVAPGPCSRRDLLAVHTSAYLRSLWRPVVLARILEVWPVAFLPPCLTRWRVLRPMRRATGGTVRACRLALERGLAVNLGGGYHHAGPAAGGGFCVYADVPLALALVDTNAHQGNGTADAIRPWPWAHLLDLYEERLFPRPKAPEEMPVPLPSLLGGASYLGLLRQHLPEALRLARPDLVVYNAGSDVLATDPLSSLRLTPDEMAERDLYVVTAAREQGVPLALVLSGGYGPKSWEAHARSLEGVLARFDKQV
jgi:histone deacetylase 11